MKFLLVLFVLQNGHKEKITTPYKDFVSCVIARHEALKHNNEVTKIKAYCKRI